MENLRELLDRLIREHHDDYVYRGQVQEYPGPLVPSGYRPLVRQSKYADLSVIPATLRRVDKVVLVERQMSISGDRETLLDYQRRQLRGFIRGFLGYALTEVLSQQAGLASESLDVTSDPDVAAFFATHTWGLRANGHKGYSRIHASPSPQYGVIYRWRVVKPLVSFDSLRSWSYTFCPPVLDSGAILRLFPPCDTLAEFMDAMDSFRDTFRSESGIMTYQGQERLFELLKIPCWIQTASRIYRQHALLLVPDALENRTFWDKQFPDFPRPEYGFWDGIPMIEDFAKSRSVDIFRFYHTQDEADILCTSPENVVSDEDMEISMVSGWIRSFLSNPSGTLPILINENIDLSSLGIYSEDPATIEKRLLSGDTPAAAAAIAAEADALTSDLREAIPEKLEDGHEKRIYDIVQSCFKERSWSAAESLLRVYMSKISSSTQFDRYLWASDRLSRALLKLRRYPECVQISENIIKLCESRYQLQCTEKFRQYLISAYWLQFEILQDAELDAELTAAFQGFIHRYETDPEIATGLPMAHVRHKLAELLDDKYDFRASLFQYDAVLEIARPKALTGEEASRLITTASFSKSNCLEKLGDLQAALQAFQALADEFSDSPFESCRYAASLAAGRAESIQNRLAP